MEDLGKLRQRIDELDGELTALFLDRMELARQVGVYKLQAKKPVLDPVREQEKIQRAAAGVEDPFLKKGVEELFQQLMSLSRKLQYRLLTREGEGDPLPLAPVASLPKKGQRAVFQGTEGSYSQEALYQYFGHPVKAKALRTFREVLETLTRGEADYGILPIENSSAGTVVEVMDLLVEFETYIVDELVLPIRHMLAGTREASLETVQRVYSHPQALQQSARYLDRHPQWQRIPAVNTAVAAERVRAEGDSAQAAVCSAYAAEVYGLKILEREINDSGENSTRFILVTPRKVFREDGRKVSLSFEAPHRSGSLYHMLSHFIFNDLNMTRIESRPIPGHPWEYRFFVDLEGNLGDAAMQNALRGIREEARAFRILGNY